jgi:hypothetical protein
MVVPGVMPGPLFDLVNMVGTGAANIHSPILRSDVL